ncbi:ComEC/Rec2 family competence protein [Candidatus Saccharibacteria bacterium]|nr:ComEC/Rec2 family competence protein [Candidatus Saccharibacteria bacterium]
MKLHASWFVLANAAGIIVGDILALIFKPTFMGGVLWVITSILVFVVSMMIAAKPLIVLAFVSGIMLIFCRVTPDNISKEYINNMVGKDVTVVGKITKDPEEKDAGKKNLILEDLEFEFFNDDGVQNIQKCGGKIFTQITNLDVGRSDKIVLSGVISEGFGNYIATVFRPEVKEIIHPEPGDLFLKFRNFFADGVKKYLPEKEAGLGLGFLLGQKSGVDKGFQESLRVVGLTHIIVASGAHLGVLISIARKIFGRLSRFSSLLSGMVFMAIFIGITGVSASMLRAGLVVGISLIAWYYGRKIHPLRLILLVAAITLMISPEYLTDLAWLLSFASFSGILIIAPVIARIFYGKSKKPGFIANTFISSISASLLCTPILIYFYGSFSLISTIANILILPTVSIAMGLTFLVGIFAIFVPLIASIAREVALWVLDYQIAVVEFFGDKKEFLVAIPAENPLIFLTYIPIAISLVVMVIWQRKKLRQRFLDIEPMLA